MKALDLLLRAKKYNANITDNEINEAIAELEALQSRSCEGCKYMLNSKEGLWCIVLDLDLASTSFCCNRYEAKDNQ